MPEQLSDAQLRALKWLKERGGSGVINRYGRLLAAGEVARQFDASTWLRLAVAGYVHCADYRVSLSAVGSDCVE